MSTYRVQMPLLASSDNVILAANTVLVVKSSRLHMAIDHQVKERVGWLLRVVHTHVVASEAKLVCGNFTASRQKLVLEDLVTELKFFPLLSHGIWARQKALCLSAITSCVSKELIGFSWTATCVHGVVGALELLVAHTLVQ